MSTGIELADEAVRDGASLLGTGDMGIGNTTASSAITAVMTGAPVESVTGRGTGIDDHTLVMKRAVIHQALRVNQPAFSDPLDVLSKVGGYEIGGIAGLMLGAAAHRVPVVIDGFIATAAALIAVGLKPEAKGYLLAAHRSAEPGHRIALDHLGLRPVLELEMRLGEGTGAALGMGLVEAALRILTEMATFEEAGVAQREQTA
jgi:nicotinate-nucleotide--dimethylbenzimidazole phosphoribosyltransferase